MRIIAGQWRGRPLAAPKGELTRPTADRTRETLFSMLVSRIGSFEGLRVADLYAGSGALAFEALSRGAERAVLVEQARASGKPEAIIEKMVDGRVRKYYEEVVLLEQVWVHDGESRVKAVVKKAGGTLVGFDRYQLGEGIEKESSDFAAEVAAVSGVAQKPAAE